MRPRPHYTPRVQLITRAQHPAVALETTLLAHGVPRDAALPLHHELSTIIRSHGAAPALTGLVRGAPTIGMTDSELAELLNTPGLPKANTANLGILMHWGASAATTVSSTMELAAAAGIRLFATGGIGGIHEGLGCNLDISSDLTAFTRFPIAVVCSGVKAILDVHSTREALETLGIPVIGYRTDAFPAFYLRDTPDQVDARFDDIPSLAAFLRAELSRARRGILIANPIPAEHAISPQDWESWLEQAEDRAESASIRGRAVTPFLLAALHDISAGRTLRANIELVKSNASLAAQLAFAL